MKRSNDSRPLLVPANEVASCEPSAEHPNCIACQRFKRATSPFMKPSGQTNEPELVNIGEGPGSTEDKLGEHFKGRSGRLLRAWIGEAGWNADESAWVNGVKCGQGTPTLKELRLCRPFLLRDLMRMKPKLIMALGASAGKALLNDGNLKVKSTRNRELAIPDLTHKPDYVTLTTHPSAYLHGNEYAKKQIISDYRQLRNREQVKPLESNRAMTLAGVQYICKGFSKLPSFGCDLEWSTELGVILTVAVYHPTWGAYWFPVDHPESPFTFSELEGPLNTLFGGDALVIGHNYTGDMAMLAKWGINTAGPICDTFVLAKMIDENYPDKTLEHLVMKHCGYPDYAKDMRPYKKGVKLETGELTKTGRPKMRTSKDYRHAPLNTLGPYNAGDAQGGYDFAAKFVPLCKELPWWGLFKMYMKAEKVLTRNTHEGFLVDGEKLDETTKQLEAEAQVLKARFVKLIRPYWYKKRVLRWKKGDLIPHDDDLRDLLFKRMRLPVIEKKKKGPSIDKFTMLELTRLAEGQDLKVIQALAGYTKMEQGEPVKVRGLKQYSTLLGHFFKRLHGKLVSKQRTVVIDEDTGEKIVLPAGIYFQPGYKIMGAKTGRLSSAPNIQQIPGIVRPSFVSRWRKKK